MAHDADIFAADLLAIENEMPDEIVIDPPDGRTIPCSAGVSAQSKRLTEEGFFSEYDLNIVIRASALLGPDEVAHPPALRARFTHSRTGIRYRVEKISDSPDGVSYSVDAMQLTG